MENRFETSRVYVGVLFRKQRKIFPTYGSGLREYSISPIYGIGNVILIQGFGLREYIRYIVPIYYLPCFPNPLTLAKHKQLRFENAS